MNYFVFDVESIGLHGEAFAVGWVVVDGDGKESSSGLIHCPSGAASGTENVREWVNKNCPPISMSEGKYVLSPMRVREEFWPVLQDFKSNGGCVVADCAWPVEAGFLIKCIADDSFVRDFMGPYPLHDLASVILACGGNPSQTFGRLPSELPQHNPLADARQSARILIEHLTLAKKLDKYQSALLRLSTLGNGERPGNSVGNEIAKEALK